MSQSICDFDSKTSNKQILETCYEQIDYSDFMIANLDCLDCYVTLYGLS
jgi:nucleoside 2-deoxyribosyltransferase